MKGKTERLIIRGSPRYITWMFHHLNKEHPKVRGNIKLINVGRI